MVAASMIQAVATALRSTNSGCSAKSLDLASENMEPDLSEVSDRFQPHASGHAIASAGNTEGAEGVTMVLVVPPMGSSNAFGCGQLEDVGPKFMLLPSDLFEAMCEDHCRRIDCGTGEHKFRLAAGDPAYASQLAALESYAMAEFITP